MAATFVCDARQAFPTTANPFVLLEQLAHPDFTIHTQRYMACGCPFTEAPMTGITYLRPTTTATNRPIHIQSALASLGYPHQVRCDTCHAHTTMTQAYVGAPEFLALDTPRHHYPAGGDLQEDTTFPGIYHETRHPSFFNGAPYRTMAIICRTPGHYVTVVPRNRAFYLVDDDHRVRRLRPVELVPLFSATELTFLARLHSVPRPPQPPPHPHVHFAQPPPTTTPTPTPPPTTTTTTTTTAAPTPSTELFPPAAPSEPPTATDSTSPAAEPLPTATSSSPMPLDDPPPTEQTTTPTSTHPTMNIDTVTDDATLDPNNIPCQSVHGTPNAATHDQAPASPKRKRQESVTATATEPGSPRHRARTTTFVPSTLRQTQLPMVGTSTIRPPLPRPPLPRSTGNGPAAPPPPAGNHH